VRTDPSPSGPPGTIGPEGAGERRHSRRPQPFVVQVAALRKVAGTTRNETRCGVIEGLAAVSVSVPEGAPISADLELSSYPGGITVTGTVRAPWRGECRRCGGTVSGDAVAEVRERYVPEGGTDEDEDAYPLVGDQLDLEPLARDAVLLDLPLAPLCSDGCLGLCPQCGANWNDGPCDCSPPTDGRWSALDSLRDQ
jgi:uncharacterized protein